MFGSKRIRELEASLKKKDELIAGLRAAIQKSGQNFTEVCTDANEKDLIIKLLQAAIRDLIVFTSGQDPASTSFLEIERAEENAQKALERNNLKQENDWLYGRIWHRYGRMRYKADYTEDGGAVVWELDVGSEKVILGPVQDADGDYIDYSSRVRQLEKKAADNEQLKLPQPIDTRHTH